MVSTSDFVAPTTQNTFGMLMDHFRNDSPSTVDWLLAIGSLAHWPGALQLSFGLIGFVSTPSVG